MAGYRRHAHAELARKIGHPHGVAIFRQRLVAEAWQVYDLDNNPVALSIVGTAWTLGMVAFLLTGGLISDRADRRRQAG